MPSTPACILRFKLAHWGLRRDRLGRKAPTPDNRGGKTYQAVSVDIADDPKGIALDDSNLVEATKARGMTCDFMVWASPQYGKASESRRALGRGGARNVG